MYIEKNEERTQESPPEPKNAENNTRHYLENSQVMKKAMTLYVFIFFAFFVPATGVFNIRGTRKN